MTLLRASRGRASIVGGDPLWDAQRFASGVVFADRLDGALPTLTQPSGSMSYILQGDHEDHPTRDTTIFAAGTSASLKFPVLNTDIASSGSVACYFGSTRTFSPGDTVWASYLIYAPIEQVYAQWSLGFGPAHKLSIFSAGPNPGNSSVGSNQSNEIVIQSNANRGLIIGYAQDGVGGYNPPDTSGTTNCPSSGSSDTFHQSAIDRGVNPLTGNDPDTGSAWSPCAQDRARYGGLSSSVALEYHARGLGDPLDGGVRQTPSVWTRVTFRAVIGTPYTANSRWTLWVAPAGSPYTQVFDKTDANFGSGPAYDTIWVLPYCSQRSPGGRKVSATGGTIAGVSVPLCSVGNALGNGTLEYTASTGRFRYHSINDGFGAAHAFSPANGINLINLKGDTEGVASTTTSTYTLPVGTIAVASATAFPSSGTVVIGVPDTVSPGTSGGAGEQRVEYTGKSGNTLTGCTGGTGTHQSGSPAQIGSSIVLKLDNAASLPSSGVTTMAVTIANGRPDTQVNYADLIVSTAAVKTRDGYSPIDRGALGAQASGMSSGSWAQVTGATGLNLFAHQTGSSGIVTGYVMEFVNDPNAAKSYFIGCDHGAGTRFLVYDEATNAWTAQAATVPWGIDAGGTTSHGYDHSVWAKGKLYHRPYGERTIRKWDGASTWTTLDYSAQVSYNAASVGVCFFPDMGTSGTILTSALENSPYGAIVGYDLATTTFSNVITQASHTITGIGDPGTFMLYSPSNRCVWFGGGGSSLKTWKMDSAGTVTAMPDMPAGLTSTLGPSGPGTAIPFVHPKTGNFVALQSSSVWYDFNPSGSGSWTARGDTASILSTNTIGGAYGVACCPLPQYGVTIFVKCYGAGGADAEMWLWKP